MSNLLNSDLQNFLRPDYTHPYMPQRTSIEFFSWVNLNISRENNKTAKMHYQLIDYLIGSDDINMQALIHRGGAKSTIMTNYVPLYVAVTGELPNFGKVENLVIFSATISQAIEQLQKIKNMWMNSPALFEFLTLAKDARGKTIADKVDYICFENRDGHVIHMQAIGSGESMRGTSKGDNELTLSINTSNSGKL